mmetsp:Transcript_46179/g.133827  ORF Transcript_46179/g.133827 Transcript_46179/m.133827 type:complete len:256 (-) Transcript_46179:251-1018(-)
MQHQHRKAALVTQQIVSAQSSLELVNVIPARQENKDATAPLAWQFSCPPCRRRCLPAGGQRRQQRLHDGQVEGDALGLLQHVVEEEALLQAVAGERLGGVARVAAEAVAVAGVAHEHLVLEGLLIAFILPCAIAKTAGPKSRPQGSDMSHAVQRRGNILEEVLFHGEAAAGDGDLCTPREVPPEGVMLHGRAHEHDAQRRSSCQQLFDCDQQEVCDLVPLVQLIEHEVGHIRQLRIRKKPAAEDAGCAVEHPGGS